MRRGPRGNTSLKAATHGEGGGGREAARGAADDAGNAKVRLRLVPFPQLPDNFLAILGRFFKPRAPQIDVDGDEGGDAAVGEEGGGEALRAAIAVHDP